MFRTVFVTSLLGSVAAFGLPRTTTVRTTQKLSMSAEFLPGALAPLGYFDPLSLSAGKTEGEVRKIREAELKHGRLVI
jgi:Chlorophyll A-B binding protein